MTDEPNSPDAEPAGLDPTRPLPTELLNPWSGKASVPTGPYAGEPALVAVPPPKPPPPQRYASPPAPQAPAPQAPYGQQAQQPILVQLGEVSISSTTIFTPAGPIPLRGSQWQVTDQWQAQHKIPTWAIVCTVLLFFVLCFLSLFFLLAKETRYTGTVQVMITNGQRQYVARIPVTDERVVQHVNAQVNYVRSLAAM